VLAAHADWSVAPEKRWKTVAFGKPGGWLIRAPAAVGAVPSLLADLLAEAAGEPVALGLDLPIGLPRLYAERHAAPRASDFPAFLLGLAERRRFFLPADRVDEIGPERPFFPGRGSQGGVRKASLLGALGLQSGADLLRCCDRVSGAAPLFWTVGAKQVGKAALHAWEHLILPGLVRRQIGLWPFEGALQHLLASGQVAVCETYPAQCLRQLRLTLKGSKRRQADRMALAAAIRDAMRRLNAVPVGELAEQIAGGFGGDSAGEDRMDSVVGVLGLIDVLAGNRPDRAPSEFWIARWEGWILGQMA
jgi:hypothetical protein